MCSGSVWPECWLLNFDPVLLVDVRPQTGVEALLVFENELCFQNLSGFNAKKEAAVIVCVCEYNKNVTQYHIVQRFLLSWRRTEIFLRLAGVTDTLQRVLQEIHQIPSSHS